MRARATGRINSGFGTFLPGDVITGVPAATVEAWVDAGIAAPIQPPRADETATAPAAETTSTRPRRTGGRKSAAPRADETATAPAAETTEGDEPPAAED